MKDKIIEKIKKVLELSKNNPSEEEAKAAALKAQRLMAEYDVTISEIDTEDRDEITENAVETSTGNKWKYSLAGVVATNFRCKFFVRNKTKMIFYGYETDAMIAGQTFKYLFEVGNRRARQFYNELKRRVENSGQIFQGKDVKNCFLIGYVTGIKEALDQQCTALMIITPPEVTEKYNEMAHGFKPMKKNLSGRSQYGAEARAEGIKTGHSIMERKKITG